MSETQFVCDLCGQRYSTFEILMTHNRLKHYHTIKFGCGYCNETFRHEDDLYCHFVLTHRVDPYAKSRCNSSESEADSELYGSPRDTLIRQAEDTCGQMRLISESDDGSESIGSSCSGESSDEEDGSDLELNYNELYMRRKRSAMTQEEISELTDVFKKSVQSTHTTKLRL